MITVRSRQPYCYYLSKYPLLFRMAAFYKSQQFKRTIRLGDPYKMFSKISVETYNRCNNTCPFCPVNINSDIRKPKFMSYRLFLKIVKELREMRFKGWFALFNNNEPLLDNRLEKFISKAVTTDANVYIWTNGKLLTNERLESLYNAGLREMIIDNYNSKLEMLPNIRKVLEKADKKITDSMKITVWLRYSNAELTNRAGLAPNTTNKKVIQIYGCFFPFFQLNINPYGKAFICCNDAYNVNITGDVNTQTLLEIWYGEKFNKIRTELIKNGRKNIIPCKFCDVMQ